MNRRTRIAAGLAGGAIAVVAVLGTAGVAAAGTSSQRGVQGCGRGPGAGWATATAEERAERLDALAGRLADGVADGVLTQEEADAILEAHEDGVLMDMDRAMLGLRAGDAWGMHGMAGWSGDRVGPVD
jgi:hypothetical protein